MIELFLTSSQCALAGVWERRVQWKLVRDGRANRMMKKFLVEQWRGVRHKLSALWQRLVLNGKLGHLSCSQS